MIGYEYDDLAFEFEPEGGYSKGFLIVVAGDDTFGAKVDLSSMRSRRAYVKEARKLYPETFSDELDLHRALNELAVHAADQESISKAKKEEDEDSEDACAANAPEEGSERYEAAMEILEAEDILEEAAADMRRLGHVGEWSNKKLAFTCAVSARAQMPVQPSTHAQSAAGKNYLWDNALSLVPQELVYKRTGFSAKALFRTKMSLRHSVLYIQELAGSEDADFSIRTLQSDNVLKWEATEKQPDGTLVNVEYEVEGPCVIVQTTTKNHLHPENETRVIPIYLDESAEQTERITKEVLRRAAGKGDISAQEREWICQKWHDAVRLLEPLEVIVPFAEQIQVPSAPLRLRRDVPRLLNLIRLVAWIHQHTRERDELGRIVATENDFHKAIAMVGESFARAWKALTPTEEKIYAAIREHVPENLKKHGFKRSHVEIALEKMNLDFSATVVKDALRSLTYQGFLESDGKRGAAGSTYTVAKASNIISGITLAVHSSISQNSQESPANPAKIMDGAQSALFRPIVHSKPSEESAMREAAANGDRALKRGRLRGKRDSDEKEEKDERTDGREWTKGSRPLKTSDLQEKRPNRRIDGEPLEKEKEEDLDYEYVTED